MTPQEYLEQNALFDLGRLKEHAETNLVRVSTSEKFPQLALLHYEAEAHFDNAWTDMARMCRGVIVDLQNRMVLAYPFEKFFNIGEQTNTQYTELERLRLLEVSEKLDGSMLILFKTPHTGEFYLTTKGSLDSEHGEYATSIMPPSLRNDSLVEQYTLMFELISNRFRIVVDYEKRGYAEGVYLIGARERATNRLLSYTEVQALAEELGVPTVKTYPMSSLDQVIETSKKLPVFEEGYVLRFSNNLMVKVKGPEYLQAHRFISKLSDFSILEAVSMGNEQMLIEVAPEEYRDDVAKKIQEYKDRMGEIIGFTVSKFHDAPKSSRKEFAVWVNKNIPPLRRAFLFNLFDKKELDNKRVCKTIEIEQRVSKYPPNFRREPV